MLQQCPPERCRLALRATLWSGLVPLSLLCDLQPLAASLDLGGRLTWALPPSSAVDLGGGIREEGRGSVGALPVRTWGHTALGFPHPALSEHFIRHPEGLHPHLPGRVVETWPFPLTRETEAQREKCLACSPTAGSGRVGHGGHPRGIVVSRKGAGCPWWVAFPFLTPGPLHKPFCCWATLP